jgi:hypothetical protein
MQRGLMRTACTTCWSTIMLSVSQQCSPLRAMALCLSRHPVSKAVNAEGRSAQDAQQRCSMSCGTAACRAGWHARGAAHLGGLPWFLAACMNGVACGSARPLLSAWVMRSHPRIWGGGVLPRYFEEPNTEGMYDGVSDDCTAASRCQMRMGVSSLARLDWQAVTALLPECATRCQQAARCDGMPCCAAVGTACSCTCHVAWPGAGPGGGAPGWYGHSGLLRGGGLGAVAWGSVPPPRATRHFGP